MIGHRFLSSLSSVLFVDVFTHRDCRSILAGRVLQVLYAERSRP